MGQLLSRSQQIDFRRGEIEAAERKMQEMLIEFCPGLHSLKQHRDRQPPWCNSCGRDARGNLRKNKELHRG